MQSKTPSAMSALLACIPVALVISAMDVLIAVLLHKGGAPAGAASLVIVPVTLVLGRFVAVPIGRALALKLDRRK